MDKEFMTKEEATTLLLEQTWQEQEFLFRLPKCKRNTHLWLHLKEALDTLKMGFDADFIGIPGRDSENFCNLNVYRNQWKRAGIDVSQLKVLSTGSVADEIAAITGKK